MLVLVLVLVLAWWLADEPPATAAPAPAATSEQPPPPPDAPPVGQGYALGGTGGPVANGVSYTEARARHRLVAPPPVVCGPGGGDT